ncbi:aminotransferase-like domain-containing protein [Leisingera sp. JC1]|uniref:aminotransferase-like domain-containing protein n=1 Tax=Leisingera sp. JC1 TaxID=1855282 RepID=UPI000803844B|nr:PLP-dependent aminotransferase family protein [Leisingera sp. JC1]OBY26552.1 GntR family transcriptional regulator [Leisingera sp. JC1]
MFEAIDTSRDDTPVYRQLADHVAQLVESGALSVGDRLPPQREIARQAGVNVTTVTRAFATLQERGLVESRPGRGSIIVSAAEHAAFNSAPLEAEGYLDLTVNRPATEGYLKAIAALMPRLASDSRFHAVQDFHPAEGPRWTRAALAGWLASATGHNDSDRIVVTNGAQHGLACALGAIARPGQAVLADAITYQGIAPLCASLDLRLVPVASDAGGMLPEALAMACRTQDAAALFLVPNLQNPTTVTLDLERRRALAGIARAAGVTIIEDDVYRAHIASPLPTIAAENPDITVHITSLSKCVAPGIRLGAVSASPSLVRDIAAILRVNCWSTSFLTGLMVTRLIEEGSLDRIIAEQRDELQARQHILSQGLAGYELRSEPTAPHGWLILPDPWRGGSFVRAAESAGVSVLPGEAFALDRDQAPPHAVRINLSAARSRDDLRRAVAILRGILEGGLHKADVHV